MTIPAPLSRPCLGLALLAAACAPKENPPEPQAIAPHRVEIDARDFAYTMPDTVPAGLTTIVLRNAGAELHHAQLMRLEEGKTLADFMAVMAEEGPMPAWAIHLGGPQAVIPGDSSTVTVELTPGHYAAFCVIPSPGPDAVMHVMKGMSKEFEVTGEPPANVVAPTPDATMVLDDYSFTLSGPLTAGDHVVRVVNHAAQWHEVVIILMAPGKEPAAVLTWMEGGMEGPPPGRPVGGTVGLGPGLSNDVTLHLEAGTYGLFCFVPDATDGKPHVAHGMVSSLTVS